MVPIRVSLWMVYAYTRATESRIASGQVENIISIATFSTITWLTFTKISHKSVLLSSLKSYYEFVTRTRRRVSLVRIMKCLLFRNARVHSQFLWSRLCHFVIFILAIVLSVLRSTDYPFSSFKPSIR